MGDCGGDLVGGVFLFGDAERERDLERRDEDLCFVRDLDPDRDLDRERERERLLLLLLLSLLRLLLRLRRRRLLKRDRKIIRQKTSRKW